MKSLAVFKAFRLIIGETNRIYLNNVSTIMQQGKIVFTFSKENISGPSSSPRCLPLPFLLATRSQCWSPIWTGSTEKRDEYGSEKISMRVRGQDGITGVFKYYIQKQQHKTNLDCFMQLGIRLINKVCKWQVVEGWICSKVVIYSILPLSQQWKFTDLPAKHCLQ